MSMDYPTRLNFVRQRHFRRNMQGASEVREGVEAAALAEANRMMREAAGPLSWPAGIFEDDQAPF